MNRQQLSRLLDDVRTGRSAVGDALDEILAFARTAPFEDLGFAKVDHHRSLRCGFPEVVFGEGKTPEQLNAIFERLATDDRIRLATRVDETQAQRLRAQFPDCHYDPVGRTVWAGTIPEPLLGRVTVITAGTGDLPVAQEAATTAHVMGCRADLLADVGVAGIHRLLSHEEALRDSDCLVVVAGMEGALPSVVGGLTDCPVIAVPTSIGYGASFGGVTALLGMLSSCAANVAVVNIDGGFCGGYVAGLIARRSAPTAAAERSA